MRSFVVRFLVVVTAIGLAACTLLPTAKACPGALLQGRLATDGGGSALVITEFGPQPVRWPDGYSVDQGPPLRLRDGIGNVVASEGETVYVGGGMVTADEVFVACGYVSRDPP